jgi:LPXTG-site transpeptidase (sortase) family protein
MRKRRKYIIFILALVVGFSILLYPVLSNLWNDYRAKQLTTSYQEKVARLEEDRQANMYEEAIAYNESLKDVEVPDAFSVRDGIEDEEYEALLNTGADGVMGIVEVPRINVQLPIYHYTTDEVLEKGAGHLFGSSLPVGGESTHAVITAHSGLPSAKLFTDLELLKEEERFYIHVLGEKLAYEIDNISVVKPDETESLVIVKGEDKVTLITCTPYAVNTHRLLVTGHRVDYDEAQYEQENSILRTPAKSFRFIAFQIVCVCVGLEIAITIVRLVEKRKEAARNGK